MRRFRFPIAVAITSLVLVAAVVVIGALAVRTALASAPTVAAAAFGFNHPGFALPPELQGLGDLPPAERFAHFVGVQVNLKDKDNRPFTVKVTPGTVTAASANSLTIAANDGTSKTFTLNEKTVTPGKRAPGGAAATPSSLETGAPVVVVTANDDPTAWAVINGGKDGFAPGGFGGPPPWVRSGWLHR